MTTQKFSLKSRIGSFKFAFKGLWSLLKYEHNSRIHLLAATMAVAMGFILKINLIEWSILTILVAIVFIAELLNTSIETLCDLVDNEWNERIKIAKDYAAGAVMVSAIISIVAGGIIFIPKIINLFQ